MTPALPRPVARRDASRGVAALTVVMVLFFVMAMVAAYTNRNLLFEQRISANSYRATRALEAADAGVEWTLAMLNGGRITADCTRPLAAGAAGLTDFRSRYLTPSASEAFGEGAFDLAWGQVQANRVYPVCVVSNATTRCTCPTLGDADNFAVTADEANSSTFRITFRLFNDDTPRGGAIQFVTRGCANPGSGNTACIRQTDDQPGVDSATALITTVGLVRALPVAPKAVLTAGTTVSAASPGGLQVANGDFASGLTVHAGTSVTASAGSRFESAAGGGGDGRIDSDAALRDLSNQGADIWFRAQFVQDPAGYRRQPAAVLLNCAAGCNGAAIADALLLNPRNPIWAEGDVNLNAAGALGSAADPAMLIVNGTLTISGDVQATGFVHAEQIRWSAPATASWDGALVSRTSFDASSLARLTYNKAALDVIRLRYGSFVRAPGGWNLF
ncbi:MAG TPA: pilus assembly PilX N-terminal domain-containing protein [Aquabacterium sp.]|nr:pilus assembly PilX N-terminal domain-containing protein [Aquabacterium sp.]